MERKTDYDVMIVGAGAAGMESALALGDMGYKVLLVEKEPSVGGKMILLSKVFPSLDCASCISTPKMAATAHHPNVTTMIFSEVEGIRRLGDGSFQARVRNKSTYVDPAKCTGCQQCEEACTVAQPDRFNFDLAAHRAAYIAFPQAVPKKAVIDRKGVSPCSHACPAGVKAHGFVSLTRAGRFDEAFHLLQDYTPLPGTLSRVCYAPCEADCSRAELEGTVSIRGIKRFFTDRYYAAHPEPEDVAPPEPKEARVAVVGSGPAGLSAAWHLVGRGYGVKVLEAAPEAGGMPRLGIPPYRLPREVLDRDLANLTSAGVEIETGRRVTDLEGLKAEGFAAVLIATGSGEARRVGFEGEHLEGVVDCMSFLAAANNGRWPSLEGKRVVVIGGGNVAIDSARVALRLGATSVEAQCRESREIMPAHAWEVEAAEEEGVRFETCRVPKRFYGADGRVQGVESLAVRVTVPGDGSMPTFDSLADTEASAEADLVIMAIGLVPSSAGFEGLELGRGRSIKADPTTFATSLSGVFACGDVVRGPTMVVDASGQGKQAAEAIDHWLQGTVATNPDGTPLERIAPDAVLARYESVETQDYLPLAELNPLERIVDFREVELPYDEGEARTAASRCLDCGLCCECQECINACPAEAIQLGMRDRDLDLRVGSVILATGFKLYDPKGTGRYGYGRHRNVITSMQMERILAPTRPYNSVLRPSDGKEPDNIAYVLCAGSRDHSAGNPLCSRVCCMYSLKHAQLLMGALPLADITIYYIDMRAYGKGYEEFLQQAKGMGTVLVKGKVAEIEEAPDGNLTVVYEDIENGGGVQRIEHDMVVLSVGLLPNRDPLGLFGRNELQADDLAWVREVDEDTDPGRTSIDGVFVAGTASEARDIPDTVLHSGAAATQAAIYIERMRSGK